MAEEVLLEAPWNSPNAKEWDNVTLQEFYDTYCMTQDAKDFGKVFCQTNVTAEPSQVSLLWYLWYIKSADGTNGIWNVEGGAQERKFDGGSNQLSEKIANNILKGKVKLNKAAYKLSQDESGVVVTTLDGHSFKGKYAILAIPPPTLLKIHYQPPLPADKTQLLQRGFMGSCVKGEIMYSRPFWREKGMNGFISCADDEEFVSVIMDDCKPNSELGLLTVFIYTKNAVRAQAMTLEERKDRITKYLKKVYGSEEALTPLRYVDKNWANEQYTGGCYTTNYPPGALTQCGRALREPYRKIYFAGTETATEWTGYMDGALQAGERAATEVLIELGILSGPLMFRPLKDTMPIRKDVIGPRPELSLPCKL